MIKPLTRKFFSWGLASTLAVCAGYVVAPFEGMSNQAYKDIVGVPTICFGQTNGVRMGDYRTTEQCESDLAKELAVYNKNMKKHVKVELLPYEEIAYTSFVWNLGETNFKNSTLLKKLNAGDKRGACNELLSWNKVTVTSSVEVNAYRVRGETCTLKKDGKNYSCTLKGLTNRRLYEQKVCLGKDEAVNAALHSFSVRQEAPETLISTSQGVGKGEPVSTLAGPLNDLEVSLVLP